MSDKIKNTSGFITKALVITALLWLVYAALSWFTPVNAATLAKYHLTATRLRMVGLTVSVPLAFIWLLAAYGAARLYQYARTIRQTPEGHGFMFLAYGTFALVAQLILSSLVNLIAAYKPSLTHPVRLFSVYEAATFAMVAFVLIAYGTKKLVKFAGALKQARTILLISAIVIAIIGWLYVRLILGNQYRTVSNVPSIRPSYGVSDTLIFLTIVPQYLIGWFAGLVALLNLVLFQRKVAGIIYRQFFGDFALGFSMIIGMSIFLQFFTQASNYFNRISFNSILMIVYALLAVIVAGYLFMAKGAKKLFKLETV